jgi:hypothetical protein
MLILFLKVTFPTVTLSLGAGGAPARPMDAASKMDEAI